MRALLLAATALISTSTVAAPTLDPMFGDHAVIQRGRAIHVRGTALPGERLTVSLAGRSHTVQANKTGAWLAEFAPMPAGGPYRLEARGTKASIAVASDLMIGDVWLCSGQSNMEWPLIRALRGEDEVASANDPQLRLMKVPKNRQTSPQALFAPEVRWQPTTSSSAREFSAACYFMARALRQSTGVAIGAIDSTWGGTEIYAWMDETAVRASGGGQSVDLLRAYRSDPEGMTRKFGVQWEKWWRDHTPDALPWLASDRLTWSPMPQIGAWEQWGDPKFVDFNGAIWARVHFTLTAEQAAQGAVLSLGMIDDLDHTFVNGKAVGQTSGWDVQRNYPLRPGLLKAGENEVIVYVLDTGGGGGFWSPPEALKLSFADRTAMPLARGWQYSMISADVGLPPTPPWDQAASATTLYNGMIAPVGPFGLKGVAWYQGEADVGRQDYDARLAAWMRAWRAQFRDPQLPFLIVGLAGFGQPVAAPAASALAALIDDQRRATDADPRSALVSAIDIGERNDIHPPNKQEVGRRLAMAAEALAYGEPKGAVEPKLLSAARDGTNIVVRFDKPMTSYGGAPLGFELCADNQESCRYASAQISGDTIEIYGDGRSATHVRYAWADYPIVNLYGPYRLPVPPFDVTVK